MLRRLESGLTVDDLLVEMGGLRVLASKRWRWDEKIKHEAERAEYHVWLAGKFDRWRKKEEERRTTEVPIYIDGRWNLAA